MKHTQGEYVAFTLAVITPVQAGCIKGCAFRPLRFSGVAQHVVVAVSVALEAVRAERGQRTRGSVTKRTNFEALHNTGALSVHVFG